MIAIVHFYFLSIFVSLKKTLCGGRCSAEPKIELNPGSTVNTNDNNKILTLKK